MIIQVELCGRCRHLLRVSHEESGPVLHTDTINIHNDRQRQRFIRRVAERLQVDQGEIETQMQLAVQHATTSEVLDSTAADDGIQWVPYVIQDRCMYLGGEHSLQIANFSAEIVEELIYDDGVEQTRYFAVVGMLSNGQSLPQIRVLAADFAQMDWVLPRWGSAAIISACRGAKDHVRAAIQYFSGNVPTRNVYSHIGWRSYDGNMFYLHADGAIGATGRIEGVETILPTSLQHFSLPVAAGAIVQQGIQASLRLLSLGPERITVPILGAVYRSALAPADFSLHLAGRSGVFKTEVAALAQQHFGASMTARNLPANWGSTANALQDLAFHAKDTVLVIDEFHPTGSTSQVAACHQKADYVLRAQGNCAGRERMRADTSLRPAKPPRGLILSTGEEVPRGESLGARMLVIEVAAGDVSVRQLTTAQQEAAAGLYAISMAGFVQWVAARHGHLQPAVRHEIQPDGVHPRTSGIVADLLVGIRCFLEYAVDRLAIDVASATANYARYEQALNSVMVAQREAEADTDPVQYFLNLVRSLLSTGRARLHDLNRTTEAVAIVENGRRHGGDSPAVNSAMIGWISGTDIYLEQHEAYAAAQRLASEQGQSLGTDQRTLFRRMRDAGLLVVEASQGGISHRLPSPDRTRAIRLRTGVISIGANRDER